MMLKLYLKIEFSAPDKIQNSMFMPLINLEVIFLCPWWKKISLGAYKANAKASLFPDENISAPPPKKKMVFALDKQNPGHTSAYTYNIYNIF